MLTRKFGLAVATVLVTAAIALAVVRMPERGPKEGIHSGQVMLILRGIASGESPRGQLDDASAREFARRLGFRGEVLDVAGQVGADSTQVKMALERIRRDETVTAIYGFSAGGYNTRAIWKHLSEAERARIRKIVVIGAPGVARADFAGHPDAFIVPDPPAGHMAGPKAVLDSLGG